MKTVELTARVLIAGKMRQPGEQIELYPWQAERLMHEEKAVEPKSKKSRKKEEPEVSEGE